MRVFMGHFIIFILLIEPKEMISPNGSAISNVRANILNVVTRPSSKLSVTVINKDILLIPIKNYSVQFVQKRQMFICLFLNELKIFTNYNARLSPYFSASLSRVPSALSSPIILLISAVRLEFFLKPIPYSSVVSVSSVE